MDYSKMSDFEINSAVHNAMLSEPYSLVFMGDDRIAWTKQDGDQIITDLVPYSKTGVHDYCNNPADSWPIIEKYRISFLDQLTEWCVDAKGVSPVFDANPLRGAMIVFLLMQESVNVQGNPA